MQIFVKQADCATVAVDVEPDTSVESLKLKLHSLGVAGTKSVHSLMLVFAGHMLLDCTPLASYGIQDDSMIQLGYRVLCRKDCFFCAKDKNAVPFEQPLQRRTLHDEFKFAQGGGLNGRKRSRKAPDVFTINW